MLCFKKIMIARHLNTIKDHFLVAHDMYMCSVMLITDTSCEQSQY